MIAQTLLNLLIGVANVLKYAIVNVKTALKAFAMPITNYYALIVLCASASFLSNWPVKMCHAITKSDAKLQSGYVKVAGRFFSIKKWPTQAKP